MRQKRIQCLKSIPQHPTRTDSATTARSAFSTMGLEASPSSMTLSPRRPGFGDFQALGFVYISQVEKAPIQPEDQGIRVVQQFKPSYILYIDSDHPPALSLNRASQPVVFRQNRLYEWKPTFEV